MTDTSNSLKRNSLTAEQFYYITNQ